MDINPPSRFWSAVGRIALLLTVIGSAVGLFRAIWPPSEKTTIISHTDGPAAQLLGTIDYFAFDLPPNIGSQLDTLRGLTRREAAEGFLRKDDSVLDTLVSRISSSLDGVINNSDPKNRQWNRLEDALKKDTERATKFKQSLNLSLSILLTDYASSAWNSRFLYDTPSYDSFVIMNIQNAGVRQAVGVELQLPYDGMATVEEPGENLRVTAFDKKIALGTILPKGERKVRLWTSSNVTSFSFDLDKWRLAYGDGVGKITWLRKQ